LHDSVSQSIVSSTGSTSSTVGPNSDSTSTATQGSDDGTEKGRPQIQPQSQLTGTVVSAPVHIRSSKPGRTGLVVIPSPIPEEEEVQRSRNPTPANSPTVACMPLLPAPVSTSTPAVSTVDVAAGPEDPRETTAEDNQHAGLVERAVEIVTSARGLIGSFWHPGPL
jgi:hypothetical protein